MQAIEAAIGTQAVGRALGERTALQLQA